MGLDYDSTVILTYKLLFTAAKAIYLTLVLICLSSHKLCVLDFFFLQDQGGGKWVLTHAPEDSHIGSEIISFSCVKPCLSYCHVSI